MTTRIADDGAAYVEAALSGCVADVAGAGKGGRNIALNEAAFRLGRLLPEWPLSFDEALAALLAAVPTDRTLTEREARYTVERALRQGEREPQARTDRTPGPGRGGTPRRRAPVTSARPPAELPPTRPPQAELLSFWQACLPVDAAVDTPTWEHDPVHWLQARKLDADSIAAGELARMIPDGVEVPPWAAWGRSWPVAGYRLLVRTWNARGECESLHARYTRPGESQAPKAVWPRGFEGRGLVMANEAALALLRGQDAPGTVVIAEGIPDWLTCAVAWPVPVFGIAAGSWPRDAAHAARIPDGSEVIIRTDTDAAGEQYAGDIAASFAGRPRVRLYRKGRA